MNLIRTALRRASFVKTIIKPTDKVLEIGVLRGQFSEKLLDANPKELVLIDCWKVFSADVFCDYLTFTSKHWDKMHDKVKAKFEKHSNVSIDRNMSADAVSNYADNSIDFIYIDANHAYEYVKEDLALWFPKVKIGGWIGGHDYNLKDDVEKAVKEFFADKQGTVIITSDMPSSYFYNKI